MRAQFIFEKINFERGGNPLDRLGVGLPYVRAMEEMRKGFDQLSKEYQIDDGYNSIIVEKNPYRSMNCAIGTWHLTKGTMLKTTSKILERGYTFKIEYETGAKHPISVYRSVSGEDFNGYYVDSIEKGFGVIRGWIKEFVK